MTDPKAYVYRVQVGGDPLGRREYMVTSFQGGMRGEQEAQNAAVRAYNNELEKAKDHTIILKVEEVETVS